MQLEIRDLCHHVQRLFQKLYVRLHVAELMGNYARDERGTKNNDPDEIPI